MPRGIVIEEVRSLREVSATATDKTKACVFIRSRHVYVRAGLHPVVRRYVLWHERIHLRIHETSKFPRDDDTLFDEACRGFYGFVLLAFALREMFRRPRKTA